MPEPIKQVKTSDERFQSWRFRIIRFENAFITELCKKAWVASEDYYASMREENGHLLELLSQVSQIAENSPELNLNNYNEEEASCLNNAMVEVVLKLRSRPLELYKSELASMREENERLKQCHSEILEEYKASEAEVERLKKAHSAFVLIDEMEEKWGKEVKALKAELLALQGKYRRLEEALMEIDSETNCPWSKRMASETLASCQLEDGEKKAEGI